ncbi:MAG TPA: Tim44 domain-containing protein [Thermoanaerobaculia bacterium]|nr:Tim44 domain-containing protein [Thermoanaerobaculia bacterium]
MARLLLLLVALLLSASDALARVGGGESFSGGGSSGGGSGGGGGDDGSAELIFYLIRFLFWLTMEYPAIGIPVDIVVIFLVIRWLKAKQAASVVTISSSAPLAASTSAPAKLDELRRFDPNFSVITFNDFCYSLYAHAHHARGKGGLDRYAPYLSVAARNSLRSRGTARLQEVRGIVVGSMRLASVRGLDTPAVTVAVVYESNYTEVGPTGESSWYVREQWTLERRRDILSPPPEKAKADHCPRCGAALQTRTDGACEYCGVKIESGAFQWYVRSINLLSREARGPLLTSNVPEQGTERPTIFQPHFGERQAAFEAVHPSFRWEAFELRVREIARGLQDAWTAREWERIRPLESETLFQSHRYWIDAYTRQRLRNIVADYRITRVVPVKIDSDAFYESITVRIWAEGRDHTVDETGRVVAGSKTELRRWTEYWTFIRSRTAAEGTQQRSCPNCGAKVALGATGICEFCGGKLSTGEFDWVLSRIEQDDVYAG